MSPSLLASWLTYTSYPLLTYDSSPYSDISDNVDCTFKLLEMVKCITLKIVI
jgi:hypothetical protein